MKELIKISVVALFAALIGGFVAGLVGGNQLEQLGSVGTRFPNGLVVGSTTPTALKLTVGNEGTAIKAVMHGTCTLSTPTVANTLRASSTLDHWCNVTGVTTGDLVFGSPQTAQASASSSPLAGPGEFGSLIFGAAGLASTTGRISVPITNLTGVATSSYVFATTSYQYWIIRP